MAMGLAARIEGKLLESAEVLGGKWIKTPPTGIDEFTSALPSRVQRVDVKGKTIQIYLDNGWTVWNTLGMSGGWKDTRTKHSHFKFSTQGGRDVWFDDVHFQAGTTSVWRRDFANGIVLVNPGDRPLDVRLEGPFRRLLGTRAPVVNDGSVSDVQTVGARDALFLLRSDLDTTPPAGVRDLRIGP